MKQETKDLERPEEGGNEPEPDPLTQPEDSPGKALIVVDQPNGKSQKRGPDNLITRILARLGLRSSGTLRDDLEDALSSQSSDADDAFSPEERAMINNILRLREMRVEDVMVPRADVDGIDINVTLDELLLEFENSGHSRLPVFSETMDNPLGMVLIKDLLLYVSRTASRGRAKPEEESAKRNTRHLLSKINLSRKLKSLKLVRSVLFVPPSMLALDLLARMQTARTQMALVIDEYGGTDGLVSLEDIIEEVFGEIEDENDEDEGPAIEKTGESVYTADSRASLDDVVSLIGPGFEFGYLGEDVSTIGGLVFALAGRIPVRGEVIHGMPGFEFRVLDADLRRIKRLQIVQRRLPGRTQRSRRGATTGNSDQNPDLGH